MQRIYSNYIEQNFNNETNTILAAIDWSDWRYVAGFDPSGTLDFTTPNIVKAQNLALSYIALNG